MRPRDYFALAELMYGDSEALPRFLTSRRTHKNLLAGSGQFIWWGLTEPVRAIRYAVRDVLPKVAPKPSAEPAPDIASESAPVMEITDASIAGLRSLLDVAAAQMRAAGAPFAEKAKKA
jgi:hypothetical protein